MQEDYQEQYEQTDWGDRAEEAAEGEIAGWRDRNSSLFNEDRLNKVLLHLVEHGQKIQGGDKLGKTIIFAANHDHAEFIAERFNKNYPHLAGKFLRVIDNQVKCARRSSTTSMWPTKLRSSRCRLICSIRASTCRKSSTWCSSSSCGRRPSSGK